MSCFTVASICFGVSQTSFHTSWNRVSILGKHTHQYHACSKINHNLVVNHHHAHQYQQYVCYHHLEQNGTLTNTIINTHTPTHTHRRCCCYWWWRRWKDRWWFWFLFLGHSPWRNHLSTLLSVLWGAWPVLSLSCHVVAPACFGTSLSTSIASKWTQCLSCQQIYVLLSVPRRRSRILWYCNDIDADTGFVCCCCGCDRGGSEGSIPTTIFFSTIRNIWLLSSLVLPVSINYQSATTYCWNHHTLIEIIKCFYYPPCWYYHDQKNLDQYQL